MARKRTEKCFRIEVRLREPYWQRQRVPFRHRALALAFTVNPARIGIDPRYFDLPVTTII